MSCQGQNVKKSRKIKGFRSYVDLFPCHLTTRLTGRFPPRTGCCRMNLPYRYHRSPILSGQRCLYQRKCRLLMRYCRRYCCLYCPHFPWRNYCRCRNCFRRKNCSETYQTYCFPRILKNWPRNLSWKKNFPNSAPPAPRRICSYLLYHHTDISYNFWSHSRFS